MSTAVEEYETAREHDRNGREAEAIVNYRRAIEMGLAGEDRRSALLGLGSSLRNVEEHAESVRTLEQAVAEFPDYLPLQAFLSLSQHSAGQTAEAVAGALRIAIASAPMDGYQGVLGEYCDALTP